MHAWLLRVWNDEEAFKTLFRLVTKYAITVAGFYAPLLVDSKVAWALGPLLAAAGANIPTRPLAPKP